MKNQKDSKLNALRFGLKDIAPEISKSSDEHLDRNETEYDSDSLEPQEFATGEGTLNVNDPVELRYWAEQFQVSTDELKSAALLQGNSIR